MAGGVGASVAGGFPEFKDPPADWCKRHRMIDTGDNAGMAPGGAHVPLDAIGRGFALPDPA